MKFDKYFPTERLRPYVRSFVISENEAESTYKVFASPGMVIGFQYKGRLANLTNNGEQQLSSAGITGIFDGFKVFRNEAGTGTVLVYFTEIGFTHFSSHPANELFNLSTDLDVLFDRDQIEAMEEKLSFANDDKQRIRIVEQFLFSQLKNIEADKLIVEAVRRIYQSNGTVRIKDLIEQLFISQSPFEKRFRKVVGTTPKKFASIVRFHTVLNNLDNNKSLTEICYEHRFFDQAHFIRDFKQYTGDTPEQFKRGL